MTENFIWCVFYWLSDESEFNFLAAFHKEADAREYAERTVWKHLRTFVSKQPVN